MGSALGAGVDTHQAQSAQAGDSADASILLAVPRDTPQAAALIAGVRYPGARG